MEIGSKLKRLRIKKNLTQEELADRCELSKGFISQIERDLASPSISTLSDLLQCLGTDLKDFFNDAADESVVFTEEDVFQYAYNKIIDLLTGCVWFTIHQIEGKYSIGLYYDNLNNRPNGEDL